ncbi:hypothetical protein [Glycomyces sp. MUSA5-2]|uniref:hypothetical protein n=1 Tax=Glycomyces sp. MUSA5-2 TaxID=2053002 RepID=UPI003009D5ED
MGIAQKTTARVLAACSVAAVAAVMVAGPAGAAGPSFNPDWRISHPDDIVLRTAGEAEYRTGPLEGAFAIEGMPGILDQGTGEASFHLETADDPEAGGLGEVRLSGTGTASVERVSYLPLKFRLVVETDLRMSVEEPPEAWGVGEGPVELASTEPLRLTATIGSLDPDEFTLTPRGEAHLAVATEQDLPHDGGIIDTLLFDIFCAAGS